MLLANLADTARVWVYQSNRVLSADETTEIQALTNNFVGEWTAHGSELTAAGEVIHNLFIVLAVDEEQAGASGCSIDKSVAFVRSLQERYEIDLLDRMTFVYRDAAGEVQTASRQNFARLYDIGSIDDDTTVFDTVVPTLGEFRSRFELPLHQSWHRRMVTMSV
jgi:hypothetical protein